MTKLEQVSEAAAHGAVRETFAKSKEALRVSFVAPMLRVWARWPRFLAEAWHAVEGNLRTRAFEEAANRVREWAVDLVDDLVKPVDHLPLMRATGLSDREIERVRDTLAVFHYGDAKLLVLEEAIRLAWLGRLPAERPAAVVAGTAARAAMEPEVPAGPPPGMIEPRLPESDGALPEAARAILAEIEHIVGLPVAMPDFQALAVYAEYFELAWAELKPAVQKRSFQSAADELRRAAGEAAALLPHPPRLDPEAFGTDKGAIGDAIDAFSRALPSVILANATLARNLYGAEIARHSPFPLEPSRRGRRRGPAPLPEKRRPEERR